MDWRKGGFYMRGDGVGTETKTQVKTRKQLDAVILD
jgi:hypothetical protein